MPPTRNFIVWRKTNVSESFSMAMAEYAWVSFDGNAKVIEMSPVGQKNRFHPTAKPVALYEWILSRYASKGDKILDPMCGSANSLIACHNLGFDYVGFEIDKEYYEQGIKAIEREKAQLNLFDMEGMK